MIRIDDDLGRDIGCPFLIPFSKRLRGNQCLCAFCDGVGDMGTDQCGRSGRNDGTEGRIR